MVSDTKTRLQTLNVEGENESIRNKLLTQLPKQKDDTEWLANVNDWVESFQPVGVLHCIASQSFFLTSMSILALTPFHSIALVYFSMLPAILSAQGELWKEGIGQFIRLEDRDLLDITIRTLCVILASISVLFLTKSLDQSYDWCIVTMIGVVLVLHPMVGRLIYLCMDWSDNDYKRRYTAIRYKSYQYLFPTLASIIGIAMGGLGLFALHAMFPSEGRRSFLSAVTDI